AGTSAAGTPPAVGTPAVGTPAAGTPAAGTARLAPAAPRRGAAVSWRAMPALREAALPYSAARAVEAAHSVHVERQQASASGPAWERAPTAALRHGSAQRATAEVPTRAPADGPAGSADAPQPEVRFCAAALSAVA